MLLFVLLCTWGVLSALGTPATYPIVLNTWGGPFVVATSKAWQVINDGTSSALDAIEQGCTACEVAQCDGTVGYGGSPDETGETTLDAMIMDGVTMDVGSVGDLRYVKNAISVARAVMEYTSHTLLVGESATEFALMMGFSNSSLTTPSSEQMHQQWLAANCQPNYRINVTPDPTTSCGPYKPNSTEPTAHPSRQLPSRRPTGAPVAAGDGRRVESANAPLYSRYNHDTIAMIVMDANSTMAAGTTTNGARFKVPGRVGDSPIAGAGAYVDNDVGGCAATGDGDTMMRFLPCFYVVEQMRTGVDPTTASVNALKRIALKYPTFQGALVSINKAGQYGAAAFGWTASYAVQTPSMTSPQVVNIPPFQL